MITSRVNMPDRDLSLCDDPSIEAVGPINRRYMQMIFDPEIRWIIGPIDTQML